MSSSAVVLAANAVEVPRRADRGHESLTNERLEAELVSLSAKIDAATGDFLDLLAEFDRREGWREWGAVSAAHWLSLHCGIALGTARERIRVAHALQTLPLIRDCLRDGRLSFSKVRELTRVAEVETQVELVAAAVHATAAHVERIVRAWCRVERQSALETVQRQYESRQLTHWFDNDGNVIFKIKVPHAEGILVLAAIEAKAEEYNKAERVAARALDNAGEPVDNVPRGIPRSSFDPTEPVWFTPADRAMRRRADAFLELWNTPTPTFAAVEVQLHVDSEIEHRAVLIDRAVAPETAQRLSCDAAVRTITHNADGSIYDVGRKTRQINYGLRRQLQDRDKGCAFPSCTRQAWINGHHIRRWSKGGNTNLDNLVSLCHHHHHAVHEGGWSVEHLGGGNFVFRSPEGRIATKLQATNQHELTPVQPPASSWDGGGLDLNYVVDNLMDMNRHKIEARSSSG